MTSLLVCFLYVNLAAVVFSALAWLGEWVLLAYGRRVRTVWAAAMLVSVAAPLAAMAWGNQLLLLDALAWVDDAVVDGLLALAGSDVLYTASGEYRLRADFGRWIQVAWAAITGLALLWLLWSGGRLRSARSGWHRSASEGEPFFVTRSVGPGVMGVRKQEILLPRWVLGLEDEARELIWTHEREHVRAGDNRLLAGGLALLILFPWVLPLWWQFRRLRVAVELDCDRRVVSASGDWRRYGRILLRVAEGSTLLPVAPFARGPSPLKRRIRNLLPEPPSHRAVRTAAAGLAMAGLLAAWLAIPVPAARDSWSLLPLSPDVLAETLDPPLTDYDEPAELLNREEVRRAVRRAYPEHLRERGVEGRAGFMIHVAPDGTVDRVRRDQPSPHEAFNRVGARVAVLHRYRPARRDGKPVGAWFFLAVDFRLDG